MNEVCILRERPSRFLSKKKILYQEIKEPSLNLKLSIYDIPIRKNKFKARHIKNIISTYNYIYTSSDNFKVFEKKVENTTLMTRLYKLCFLTLTKLHSIDKDNKQIALVVKKENIDAICELCSIIRFPVLYNCGEDVLDIIYERTGVCAPYKRGDPKEDFKIVIDSDISFLFKETHYKEVTLKLPQKLLKYEGLPIYDIFVDYIKLYKEIPYKNIPLKVVGFTKLDKSEFI